MIGIKASIKYAEYVQYLNITIYCYYYSNSRISLAEV